MGIVILDHEMKGFENKFVQALNFDIVMPMDVSGEAGIHFIDIEVKMTNGDELHYCYRENPSGEGEVIHYIEINGERHEPGIEVDPVIFTKSEYTLHLSRLIRKKV